MPDEPATAPENEVDESAAQESVGRENMSGQGEWPDPDTPPSGPASGEAERDDSVPASDPSDGAAPTMFKDVLEADPVVGGSASIGENEFEDPPAEASPPPPEDDADL